VRRQIPEATRFTTFLLSKELSKSGVFPAFPALGFGHLAPRVRAEEPRGIAAPEARPVWPVTRQHQPCPAFRRLEIGTQLRTSLMTEPARVLRNKRCLMSQGIHL